MPWKDPLLAAVKYKCSLNAKRELESGANPEGPIPDIITPLQIAVDNDDASTVKILIRYGADLNYKCSSKETPLHIASLGHVSFSVFKILVDSGADASCTDFELWTPLHLAAAEVDFEKLKYLLRRGNAPVLAKDEEGATPMHLLIEFCDNVGEVVKIREMLKLILRAGYKVSTQTKEGETILHYASHSEFADMLLEQILPLAKEKELLITDKLGNNFLHTYFNERTTFEDGEPFLVNFLKGDMLQMNREVMAELLNQPNVYGKTTLLLYLGEWFQSVRVVQLLLNCGSNINISDDLRNSVLHQVLNSPLLNDIKVRIMKCLLRRGACVNARDIFGRTPIYLAKHMNQVRILIENKADINISDICRRSPLMAILRTGKPNICQYLINCGADVNHRDKFGANALHHAAWVNMIEVIAVLLRNGTDINQRDRDGKTPLDISKHWRCRESCELLMTYHGSHKYQIEHARPSAYEDNILPLWVARTSIKTIHCCQLEKGNDLKSYFNIPSDISIYLERVLKTPGVGQPRVYSEAISAEAMVLTFVDNMAKQIYKLDKRFRCTIFRSGSTFEDTKVGDPDEFDFVFCLHKFQNVSPVLENERDEMNGFISLMINEPKTDPVFQKYINEQGLLLCRKIRVDFYNLVRRVLYCPEIWTFDEFFIDDITIRNPDEKPIVNFRLFMTGIVYKYLEISIDIVPAIRKRGWWPSTGRNIESPFITEEMLKEGCLFLCQIPDIVRYKDSYTKFRISCAPAEILLVRSFPVWVKDSYSLSKMLKSNFMCPQIKFSSQLDDEIKEEIEFAENVISSYMLKNSLFHVLSDEPNIYSQSSINSSNIQETLKLALKIYEYLQKQSKKGCLQCYVIPSVNILSFNMSDEEPENKNDVSQWKEIQRISVFAQMIRRMYSI